MKAGSESQTSKESEHLTFIAGILSDTHGWLDDAMIRHLEKADEIWHAGDFGENHLTARLADVRPLRGVYGNIDGQNVRSLFPELLKFEASGLKVMMTHIGGKAGSYPAAIKQEMDNFRPDIFICGHSHILKIMPVGNMLHLNPGAAGRHGFHHLRTMVMLTIESGRMKHLDVVELGPRTEKAG